MAGHKKTSGRRRRKRKLILFVVELIILVLVVGVFYFYRKLDKIDTQSVDKTQIEVNDISQETAQVLHGYTTIAVFGLDNRTMGNYQSGLSDVIMVMAINNDTHEVRMASVYRDTYLNVAGINEEKKFRKANSAYSYGGQERALLMLNRNLDLDVDNYVAVDFYAVAEAVDILGGVDIEIESNAELGYLNDYIMANNEILGTDVDTIDSTGMHTLNGVQAVAYARIRYTSGGDFKRAERQRRVFSEMVKKAKKANLSQVNELIDTVFPDVQTDLSKKDLITMATAMLGYDMSESGGFPYDRTTATPSKAIGSIVIPCDLESNVKKLHAQLYDEYDYVPSQTVIEYSDYIKNNTGKTAENAETDQFSDSDDFTGSQSQTTDSDTAQTAEDEE